MLGGTFAQAEVGDGLSAMSSRKTKVAISFFQLSLKGDVKTEASKGTSSAIGGMIGGLEHLQTAAPDDAVDRDKLSDTDSVTRTALLPTLLSTTTEPASHATPPLPLLLPLPLPLPQPLQSAVTAKKELEPTASATQLHDTQTSIIPDATSLSAKATAECVEAFTVSSFATSGDSAGRTRANHKAYGSDTLEHASAMKGAATSLLPPPPPFGLNDGVFNFGPGSDLAADRFSSRVPRGAASFTKVGMPSTLTACGAPRPPPRVSQVRKRRTGNSTPVRAVISAAAGGIEAVSPAGTSLDAHSNEMLSNLSTSQKCASLTFPERTYLHGQRKGRQTTGIPLGAFGGLPAPALRRIVQDLPFADRIRLAACSNQLGNVIYSLPCLWQDIAIPAKFASKIKDSQLAAVLRKCNAVQATRSLSLIGCHNISPVGIMPLKSSAVLEMFDMSSSHHFDQNYLRSFSTSFEALLRPMLGRSLSTVRFGHFPSPGMKAIENETRPYLGHFRKLPDSILLKIAEQLAFEQRVQLASSCKALREVVYSCKAFWRNITFPEATAKNVTDEHLRALLINVNAPTTVKSVSLRGCVNERLTGRGLAPLRYSGSLEQIDLRIKPCESRCFGDTGLDDNIVASILSTMLRRPSYHVNFPDTTIKELNASLYYTPVQCQAMYTQPENVRRNTMTTGGALSQSHPVRETDADFYIHDILLSLIHDISNTDQEECVVQALYNLGKISSQGCTVQYNNAVEDVLPLVIELLASCSKNIVEEALILLQRNLQNNRSGFTDHALKNGLLPALEHLLKLPTEASTRPPSLLHLQQRCAWILNIICTDNADVDQLVPVVPLLAEAVSSNDTVVSSQALWALANISDIHSDNIATSILDANIIPGLINHAANCTGDQPIVTLVLRTLKNLSSGADCTVHQNVDQMFLGCHGLTALQRLLLHEAAGDVTTRSAESTSKAIAVFATRSQERAYMEEATQLSDVAESALSVLIQSMNTMNSPNLNAALTAIDTMLQIGQHYDDQDLIGKSFRNLGGGDCLERLIQHDNADVSGNAAELYEQYFARPPTTRCLTSVKVRKQVPPWKMQDSRSRYKAQWHEILVLTNESLLERDSVNRFACSCCNHNVCTLEEAASILPNARCDECEIWSCAVGEKEGTKKDCTRIKKCNSCDNDYCADCLDVAHCLKCSKDFCEGCRDVLGCDLCLILSCDLCSDSLNCDGCNQTFCETCRDVGLCDVCGTFSCGTNGCVPMNWCNYCDTEKCSECSTPKTCFVCQLTTCGICSEDIMRTCGHCFGVVCSEDCSYSCDTCKTVSCEHGGCPAIKLCEGCETLQCDGCVSTEVCSQCEEDLCTDCMGTCATCGDAVCKRCICECGGQDWLQQQQQQAMSQQAVQQQAIQQQAMQQQMQQQAMQQQAMQQQAMQQQMQQRRQFGQ